MKLRKTTITIEILSDEFDYPEHHDIRSIAEQCTKGDWSMDRKEIKSEIIEGKSKIISECKKHGTDVEFFFPEF